MPRIGMARASICPVCELRTVEKSGAMSDRTWRLAGRWIGSVLDRGIGKPLVFTGEGAGRVGIAGDILSGGGTREYRGLGDGVLGNVLGDIIEGGDDGCWCKEAGPVGRSTFAEST